MRTQTMHEAYRGLLSELYHRGLWETNARTGVGIKMVEGGWSFKLDLSDGRLPVAGNRRYFPRVAAAEVAWQFMGTKDPAFIVGKAPKLWEKFVEDGELKTAYGYRWREHFGRDQLALAIRELRDNPTNRQLYISAWDPAADGLGGPQPKNIPCPVGFSLTRTEDRLHCSVFIRSSDVFVGLPYDVMGYALTLDAVAASAGLIPGTLHVTLAHPHYYDPHAQAVEDCVYGERSTWASGVEPNLPGWSVEDILSDPDGYVTQVGRLAKRVEAPEWNPMPEVIE
ncbi:thymidylate synthase [Brucella abortus]|uniref:thymidylate synthase n=1 Tax=Brucella abortus TaxID=235 RepID=UPI0004E92604|nr:thymidylate synthase [Brucella abortus]KFH18457.1 hypothetical protein IB60_17285 [Brucella abortus LMN1]RUQ67310.1 thymidylate synthase [Brucella abortus]RUQ78559.1 thymidylate synthase [Brucella abortus]RUQ88301.1 thymidylate synthase [Brucella abortus]RUQ90331.1 thymidylate synthase [Brucella abortus]